ncbi:unnamed protein product [Phytophthora fragariaefolia]|uniref:Unnamed protein product n=1 Tax=Phytophthora fragariaefolia TaxID=1490495 RepID=A0A9W6WV00_9STRA|nr:unnamed protein product [Phytophthora fragariaefolia]
MWQLLDDFMCDASDKEKDAARGQVHTLMQWSWPVGVLTTLQGIWWRRCLYRVQLEDTSVHRAEAVLRGRLTSVYHTIRHVATEQNASMHRHAAAKVCVLALTTVACAGMSVPGQVCPIQHTLLFFDGGSRGNPGPGGAGSVIIQVGGSKATARILRMASVSYAHKTSNNVAAYHGLMNGLRLLQAVPHDGRQAYGNFMDSSSTSFNKMVDHIASIAMATQKSVQVEAADMSRLPFCWTPVLEFRHGDVEHWLDNNPDMTDSGRPSLLKGVG